MSLTAKNGWGSFTGEDWVGVRVARKGFSESRGGGWGQTDRKWRRPSQEKRIMVEKKCQVRKCLMHVLVTVITARWRQTSWTKQSRETRREDRPQTDPGGPWIYQGCIKETNTLIRNASYPWTVESLSYLMKISDSLILYSISPSLLLWCIFNSHHQSSEFQK